MALVVLLMTLSLAIIAVIASTGFYAAAERWLERRVLHNQQIDRRRTDTYQLWLLRATGIWLTFWLLIPIATAQSQLTEQNRQQIIRNQTRLENLGDRVAAIEALRLDARLSAVEETREEVRTMRQWLFGIFGGVAVTVVVQLLQLLGRPMRLRTGDGDG